MAKATKRSRPGRRLERKYKAWFPLRRPVLLAALGLCGWAPAGAADFPPTLDLSSLDGTNGFRLAGVAGDLSGFAVSAAGDVNGDGIAEEGRIQSAEAWRLLRGGINRVSGRTFGYGLRSGPFPRGAPLRYFWRIETGALSSSVAY